MVCAVVIGGDDELAFVGSVDGDLKVSPIKLRTNFHLLFLHNLMSILEETIARLNTMPAETNKHLRSIQDLDRKFVKMEAELRQRQKEFEERFRQQRGRKVDNRTRELLENQYREIMRIQKGCATLANDKVLGS